MANSTRLDMSLYEADTIEIRERILQDIRGKESELCSEMEKIWLKMFGKNRNAVIQRYESIRTHVTELFTEMLDEERENLEDLRDSLEALVSESKLLKVELALDITLPFDVDIDGIDLKQQKQNLESFLEKYKQIKGERIASLERYKTQEKYLCSKLGVKTHYYTLNVVPSESKLKEINVYLKNLDAEKEIRTLNYLEDIVEIEQLMKQLESSPCSTFEKLALDTNSEFQLSDKNMEMLKEWKMRLMNEIDKQTKLITELQEKIKLLWERLDVDAEEKEQFMGKTAKKCGKSVIEEFKKELQRCEQLKKVNIETVVLRLRNQISDLWKKCHISEEEKNKYKDFFNNNFDEVLLESHEHKIEELQSFYNQTSEIYELAEKWFELWNKMISMENQSNNVERLNNRGGQLLKEERERKRIQKELPKVETKLEKLIQKFEADRNKPFFYDGIPLMALISTYWDNRKLEKENEKEIRKIQNATRITPLKNCSRIQTPVSSALASRKRTRPITPVENTMKTPVRRQLKMTQSKTEKIDRRRSRSQEPLGRYPSNPNLRSASVNSSVESYIGFQNYIETRSKVKNGMPLRSSPPNTITPIKRRRPIIC